jgi:hypothetical protein
MSTLCQDVINDAKIEFADPSSRRVDATAWTIFLNNTLEDVTRRWKVMEVDATYDLQANVPNYLYPDDCVQVKGMKWTTDATQGPNQYRWMKEWFDGEARRATALQVPTGDITFHYHPRAQFFEIIPTPDILIPDGGWIQYWKLADRITDPTTTNLPIPDTTRSIVRWRMIIFALRLTRDPAWKQESDAWEVEVDKFYDRLEDRSDDRPEALQPVSWDRAVRRLV